jgi:Ser/Thr protein kinase RdoA (MazF antagonist)
MYAFIMSEVLKRLSYRGNLKPVFERVAEAYKLGDVANYRVIEVGYEDCNVKLDAGRGKFLVKIFAKSRSGSEITRYSEILRVATDQGVRMPHLIRSAIGDVYKDETGLEMVLLQYIAGKTFYELSRAPSHEELDKVLEQAARINGLKLRPTPLFDSWSVQNLEGIYEKIHHTLDRADLQLVDEARRRFRSVPLPALPHAFVHGDITKANTILSNDGKVYIIDFAVANWYPRIQELAVIGANLMHEVSTGHRPREVATKLVEAYQKHNALTSEEERHLPQYLIGAIAMEFLGGSSMKLQYGQSDETKYWIELGRKSLREAIEC